MEFFFSTDKPIYLQIMDTIKLGILSGEFPKGSRLASVRDLAIQANVNPNTMQKALLELERLGFIRTERTSGRFITDDEDMISSMKVDLASLEVKQFLNKMNELGLNTNQTIELIKSIKSTEDAKWAI